jgi:hypothetical protein
MIVPSNFEPNTIASSLEIPIEWAEAFYKLRQRNRPCNIPMADWLRIQYNAISLHKKQPKMLKTIIACEWSLLDVYGCFSSAPTRRFEYMGLLIMKNQQERVVSVIEDCIKLQRKGGSVMGFYKPLVSSPSRVLLYELN